MNEIENFLTSKNQQTESEVEIPTSKHKLIRVDRKFYTNFFLFILPACEREGERTVERERKFEVIARVGEETQARSKIAKKK